MMLSIGCGGGDETFEFKTRCACRFFVNDFVRVYGDAEPVSLAVKRAKKLPLLVHGSGHIVVAL